jgi:hypothetical protein
MLQALGDEQAPSLTAQQATSTGLDAGAISDRLNAADPRNGVYYVYAADGTNGTRQKLSANFDTHSYTLTDSQGQTTSGTFSEDAAEPGTYVFASDRITSVANTARFRVTPGAIVGAFPFEKPWSNPVSYQVVPFVAARAFVTDPAQLDDTYNRFGVSRNSNGTSDSQILAMRISGHGTKLEMCFDNTIYRIDSCPAASKRTYAITASPDFVWTAINVATPSDLLQFRMARIGGQNVWLSGGYTDAAPDVHVFRVGLQDSASWPVARYIGASTDAKWGTNLIRATDTVRSTLGPDGITETSTLPLGETSLQMPQGIRLLNVGGEQRYFAMQAGALSVIVGSRNPNTQGYIQVNLLKDNEGGDPRNGTYQVFSVNGAIHALTVDFDTGSYSLTEKFTSASTSTGTFSADPADPGTYLVASTRISSAVNTARFRVAEDTLVGALPFFAGPSNPTGYAVQPFIAARSFVNSRAEIPGAYDFAVVASPTGLASYLPSNLLHLAIPAGGMHAQLCNMVPDGTCTDQTPAYSIRQGDGNEWALATSDGISFLHFYIAKMGERRLLLGGYRIMLSNPFDPMIGPILIAGVRQPSSEMAASWPIGNAHSFSATGAFGTTTISGTSYAASYTRPDGALSMFSLALQVIPSNTWVRTGTDGLGTPYAVIQDGRLVLAVPNDGAASQLHVGLMD